MDASGREPVVRAPVAESKDMLRRDILHRRDAVPAEFRKTASGHIRSLLQGLPELSHAHSIAAFWPIRSEVDLRPTLESWNTGGKIISLPVIVGNDLVFRHWHPECRMEKKAFGLMEPAEKKDEIAPDILLVPLVGFDRTGGRLGYGKGYYDRAIASLGRKRSIMTIGVAFAMQESAFIPLEPHDRHLDMIVTEAEIIRVQGER